jgi:glycosyltransferase involved in cell wall biosynthesis
MISYSIVLSAYNQADTLKLALESLRRQIKNPKTFEIIIADDCSSDDTESFVKKLRYPIFMKYTKSDKVQGRAKNRNRGFQKVTGEWVIFMDGDMVPGPAFIEAYFKSWDEFPDAVVIGSWAFPDGWKKLRWHNYLARRGCLLMAHGDKIPGKYFTSGNFAIKRTLLERLCGFDESFEGWGGEDTDFGLRLENESIPIRFIPEARSHHYHKKTLAETLREYEKFGRGGFPVLAGRYPDKIIFEKGWLLGLPGPEYSFFKQLISILLYPARSALPLALLSAAARIGDGALFSDPLFDWLFYGHLARGYRDRKK